MASHGVVWHATSSPKSEQERQTELREIQEYKDLEDLIKAKVAGRQYTLEVLGLTSKLLRKNPEYYTIWNVRRRLLIHGLFSKQSDSSSPLRESQSTSQSATTNTSSADLSSSTTILSEDSTTTPHNPASQTHGKNGTTLDLITADLEFLFPIMLKFPKCYWIWNYRLWLLHQANERLVPEIAKTLWNGELKLVGKMLVRDSRNFHGWGYRRMVVSQLESQKLDGKSMIESEFDYTTKMIHGDKGLSNFSAWHRRSKLIPRLLNERHADDSARKTFLDNEFDLIVSAMYTDSFPYAQSAWFYYQFLIATLTEDAGHNIINPNFTTLDRAEYLVSQLDILKDMLDGAEDCKWIYSALVEGTTAICHMQNRTLHETEVADCKGWLVELKKLDPLRDGRWNDMFESLSSI